MRGSPAQPLFLALILASCLVGGSHAAEGPSPDVYPRDVLPLLNKYCNTCHNEAKNRGGVNLDEFKTDASIDKDHDLWAMVRENAHGKLMPPKKSPQPTQAERDTLVKFLDARLARIDCGLAKNPGKVTMRRLNRAEYNHTIRDLVGVNFSPADDFPADDVGYGFDNIGDVLSVQPLLMEKYLAAADKILDAAIVTQAAVNAGKETYKPQNLQTSPRGLNKKGKVISLVDKDQAFLFPYEYVYEGEYIFRIKAYGDRGGDELPKMSVRLDDKQVQLVEVDAINGQSKVYEVRTRVKTGRHTISGVFVNDFYAAETPKSPKQDRNLYVETLQIDGPHNPAPSELPATHKKLIVRTPASKEAWDAAARENLAKFALRAYRRPVTKAEIDRMIGLFNIAKAKGEPFENCLKLAYKGVLVSPNFLFRVEPDPAPGAPDNSRKLTDFELATRLSYFLWASMPDDELLALAGKKELSATGVMKTQVTRMLKDPKASALTKNFAGQWLQLRNLETFAPDKSTFPAFNEKLRAAMIRETEMFFENVVKEDRPVTEFIDADYSFLNETLARHYMISGVKGDEYRKVTLADKLRGGVLTQASILTLTSNPTRTSPVKRGKFVLENILGTPPPPPPPDVGELDDKKGALTGTLRQRMEKHRENPSCASCHQRMDPLGFGLENFDGIGRFRSGDGGEKIDPSGVLPGGESFQTPAEMRKVLLGKADMFRKCLAEKLLTYAIGRGLEQPDRCSILELTTKLTQGGDKFSALVMAIVESEPFLKKRGKKGP